MMNKARLTIIAIVIGAALLAGGLVYLWMGENRGPAPSAASIAESTPAASPEQRVPETAAVVATAAPVAPSANILTIAVLNIIGQPIDNAQISITAGAPSKTITHTQRAGAKIQIPDLPHSSIRWSAKATGHKTASGEFDFRPDNAALTIFLDPVNPPLRGMVVDGDGKPLPGILVRGQWTHDRQQHFEVRSDEAGRFIYLDIPQKGQLHLTVHDGPRLAASDLVTLPPLKETVLSVVLDGFIMGRVLNPATSQGQNEFSAKAISFSNTGLMVPFEMERTGGPGGFSMQLAPGQYRLTINADNGWLIKEPVTVESTKVTDIGDLILDASGATLTVKLLQGDPPQPFSQCSVNIVQSRPNTSDNSVHRQVSGNPDGNGIFKAASLPEGEYQISVTLPNPDQYTIERSVRIASGEDKTMEIIVPKKGIIEGRVVSGSDRQPVIGARIEWNVVVQTPETNAATKSTETGPDGLFLIPEVLPEKSFQFRVIADGWAAKQIELTPAKDREWVEIVLANEGATLAGRVVAPDDSGLEGDLTLSAKAVHPNYSPDFRSAWQTKSGKDGRFEFESIPANQQYTLTATVKGFVSRSLELNGVPGEPVIIKLERERELRLLIVHADQSRVNGRVDVYKPDNNGAMTLLASQEIADGNMKLPFQDFEVPIEFRHGAERGRRVFYRGDRHLQFETVVLSPASRLTVNVLGPDGAALSGAEVKIFSSYGSGVVESQTTGAAGQAAFDVLPGDYQITAAHPEFVTRTTSANISDGSGKSVTIRFEQGALLEIQVVDAETGMGVAQAPITLLNADGGNLIDTITDDTGIASFQALPPGGYGARVLLAPGVFLRMGGILFDDSLSESQRVFFRLPPLHRVTLRFLRGGAPVEDSYAYLIPEESSIGLEPNMSLQAALQTNSRGEAIFSVPSAPYQILLMPQDFKETISITSADDGREFEFNMTDHLVTVKVLDAETLKPIAKLEVAIFTDPDVEEGPMWSHTMKTDSTGQVIFAPPFDGAYKLAINAQDGYGVWVSESFTMSADHSRHSVEAELTKRELPEGQLIMRLVDENTLRPIEEPIENFVIWDYNAGVWANESVLFTLPQNGVVALQDFQTGHYWAQLFTPHYVSEKLEFIFPEKCGIALQLKGARKASARIIAQNLPEDFDSTEPFILAVFDPVNRSKKADALWAWLDKPCGPFRPGLYFYRFDLPGLGEYSGLVELLAGETTDINITVGAPPPTPTPAPTEQ